MIAQGLTAPEYPLCCASFHIKTGRRRANTEEGQDDGVHVAAEGALIEPEGGVTVHTL